MTGDTEPTPTRVALAYRLLDLHEADDGSRSCWWCLNAWPCEDARWSRIVLRRAAG